MSAHVRLTTGKEQGAGKGAGSMETSNLRSDHALTFRNARETGRA